ncbi:MAG: transporter rane protein [Deltaproteobacteria bacterium]|nr:transporter rane protein [Deltaproteobacteria bacterium]
MILRLAGLRHLSRHPLQLIFGIVGVALGVAAVFSIDLANESARHAFRISAQTVSGKATHRIVGGPSGLEEGVYATLRRRGGLRAIAPIVEGYALVTARPGLTLHILGIDPFAEAPFRNYTPGTSAGDVIPRLLTRPGAVLLLKGTAERLGVSPGGTLRLRVGLESRNVTLAGFLQPGDEVTRQALETTAVADISTAQELLGKTGRLSRIDLLAPAGAGEEGAALSRIRELLPPEAEIIPAGAGVSAMEQMTRAFSLNLSALSLLALVVGMFLVYNTMTFSVLQRRQLMGTLRALGVTRGELFAQVLSEAAILGAVGTALGLPLGFFLGEFLLGLVTRSIGDLYFALSVREVSLTAATFLKAVGLGTLGAVAASLWPAHEATSSPARDVMRRSAIEMGVRKILPAVSAAGAGLILLGAGVQLYPSRSVPLSFGGLFAIVAGYALLAPGATTLLVRGIQPVLAYAFGTQGTMAARSIPASISRTGVAAAALVVAVSTTVGIGIMIDSFRRTVSDWLDQSLRSDIYISSAEDRRGPDRTPLPPDLVEGVSSAPGIQQVALVSRQTLESPSGFTELFILRIPRESFDAFRFREGNARDAWEALHGGAVIVSDPYAYRHGVRKGDTVRLRTDRGEREFPVAGVYYDYSSDQGLVGILGETYERFWDDRGVDSIGIRLPPGTPVEAAIGRIREIAGERPVLIRSNRSLREASLQVFDRTFAVTNVLRSLTVLIAFVGVLNALMAIQMERGREHAVLRAIGLTPRQTWGLVAGESAVLGAVTGILAVPLGAAQALVLIRFINRRSFGWTMQTFVDPWVLLQAVGLALAASLLAGLYPATRLARSSPAQALQEE